ncbi:hypothetical protein D3C84_598870 [compost metagenome]
MSPIGAAQVSVAPDEIEAEEPCAEPGGQQEWQADIQLGHGGPDKRANGIADIGQGVFDREHFAAFGDGEQAGKPCLDRDIDHRIRQVDQHQAEVEQPEIGRKKGAEKPQGEHRATAQNQPVAGHPVHQEATVETQQRADDQCAANDQADVGDAEAETAGKVDDQIRQGDPPREGQYQGGRQQ